MRAESDSNKAPQDEQTDWLAGRARHFLPLKHYFLNFHFNHRQPPGRPPAWSLGGRRQAPSLPTVVSIEQRSLTSLRCAPSAAALFHTCEKLYRLHSAAHSPSSSILHLPISLSCTPPPPPPTSLCKHFTIFKHNAITPNFHTDVGSRRQTFAFPQSSLY